MLKLIKKEALFFIFFGIFILIFNFNKIPEFISYINFNVILTLSAIILISDTIKKSNYLTFLLEKIIKYANTQKKFALIITISTILLSMIITNDISLFITIPLILSLNTYLKDKEYIAKLIIFQAFAANSGSMLSPIGNPQNIYLFHHFNINFFDFIKIMFLPFIISNIFLLLMIIIFFESKKINLKLNNITYDKKLFLITLIIFFFFLLFFKINILITFIIIFLSILTLNKKAFKEFDYFLILTFIFMFIDIKYLIYHYSIQININSTKYSFLFSAFLYQFISNVPASIISAHLFNDFKSIAWGVNLGGYGLIIGSFANIIALRFFKYKNIYRKFHFFSIPYFLITLIICYFYV